MSLEWLFQQVGINLMQSLVNNAKFHKYVTCKRCYSIYKMSDCLEVCGSRQVSKTCSHVALGKKSTCNNVLLKTVELASNKKIFYPLDFLSNSIK